MKIAPPQLSPHLSELSLDAFLDGDLEEVALRSRDATNSHITSLDINNVLLEKVILTASQFERINARDMKASHCDFSAAMLANGSINRAEFNACRMTGVDFSKTALHDVTFKGCKLDMANFRFANIRRVKFTDCTFTETDFLGASLHDATFEACVLEKTVFDQVSCKQVDLRGSQLIDIVGWRSLKGVIIDDLQLVAAAPYLAQELGIKLSIDF